MYFRYQELQAQCSLKLNGDDQSSFKSTPIRTHRSQSNSGSLLRQKEKELKECQEELKKCKAT